MFCTVAVYVCCILFLNKYAICGLFYLQDLGLNAIFLEHDTTLVSIVRTRSRSIDATRQCKNAKRFSYSRTVVRSFFPFYL